MKLTFLRCITFVCIFFLIWLFFDFLYWHDSPSGRVSTNIVHNALQKHLFSPKNNNKGILFKKITPFKWDTLYLVPKQSLVENRIFDRQNGENAEIDISELTHMIFILNNREVYRERLIWGGGVFHSLFEEEGNVILGYQVEWHFPTYLNDGNLDENHFYYRCSLASGFSVKNISSNLIVLAVPNNCERHSFSKPNTPSPH